MDWLDVLLAVVQFLFELGVDVIVETIFTQSSDRDRWMA